METPRGFSKPRRALFTGVVLAVALAVVAVLGVAVTHRIVKGDFMPDELHRRQVAEGVPVGDRQTYGAEDFTEPKSK